MRGEKTCASACILSSAAAIQSRILKHGLWDAIRPFPAKSYLYPATKALFTLKVLDIYLIEFAIPEPQKVAVSLWIQVPKVLPTQVRENGLDSRAAVPVTWHAPGSHLG